MSYGIVLDWRKCRWLKRTGLELLTEDVIREILPTDERHERYGFEALKRDFQFYRRYKNDNVQIYSLRYLSETPLNRLKYYHRKNLK